MVEVRRTNVKTPPPRAEFAEGVCPLCGGNFTALPMNWLVGEQILIAGDNAIYLNPKESEYFDALWRARNRGGMTHEELFNALYGADPNGGPVSNIVSALASQIRKKLRKLGSVTIIKVAARYRICDLTT